MVGKEKSLRLFDLSEFEDASHLLVLESRFAQFFGEKREESRAAARPGGFFRAAQR
jgi:hypothetical protein